MTYRKCVKCGVVFLPDQTYGHDCATGHAPSAMTDTQPLSAEELDYFIKFVTKVQPTLPQNPPGTTRGSEMWAPRLAATITQLQAQVAVLVENAAPLLNILMSDRGPWRECQVCGGTDYKKPSLEHEDGCRYYSLLEAVNDLPAAADALLKERDELNKAWLEAEGKLSSLEADRDHWKERAEKAEANQRTPGTVEVCELCGDRAADGKFHPSGMDRTGRCPYAICPIRQETER